MKLMSQLLTGLFIFLFTLYQYQNSNLPIPSFNQLELHTGTILSTHKSKSIGKKGSCRFGVRLDSNMSEYLSLPCFKGYKEVLNLVGESAEIRTHPTEMWGVFSDVEVWDVVVSGKHYYKYADRSHNQTIAQLWVILSNFALWVGYIYWLYKNSESSVSRLKKRRYV
ncbi:hypothetical protein SNR37_000233 [Agarivorans aestuarii]|uniref:Uncharacterized protein n=1 Tax=Agarivorans aestuarii TaxID=1563703 RepID=A0ABU7G686_9ALTE|nr:hypothetical protein [Agarivorans aestuarii]MEE1674913.1 hypothetical protein [Agarivorans aestuarii]